MSDWLPLFPLSHPLFPGLKLNLQIFEQRYIKLVKGCLREDSGFGICAINQGREIGLPSSIYPVGVECFIVDWRQMPNGLLGITVEGRRRFTFSETEIDPDSLLNAKVEYLEAEEDQPIPDGYSGLVEIYEEMRNHPEMEKRLPNTENLSASALGNGLAQVLPMHMQSRIQCFEMSDSLARLDFLVDQIQKLTGQ